MVKKILFVTHQLSRTGAPQVLLNMIQCCRERGHAVMVISLSDGDAKQEWESKDIDVTVMPQLLQVKEQMVPIFRAFDLVVVNTLVCLDVIPICVAAGVKTFWWIHEHENYFHYYRERLPKESELGSNVQVLAVSPLTAKLLEQYAGYHHVSILPFSVQDVGYTEKGIGNGSDKKLRFMCVAVYAYVKGQDIFCKAIESLTDEERSRCSFAFYGDRSEVDQAVYEPVEKAAEAYPEVSVYDAVPHDELLQKLKESDFLIIPSRKEPMPTVAVEAMMLGRPCILSDICGVTDWLNDGTDALFFEAESVEELTERIREAINMDDPGYRSMAQCGREIYEKSFSEAVFEESIAELVEGEPLKILEVNENSFYERYGISLQQVTDRLGATDSSIYEKRFAESAGQSAEKLIPEDVRLLVCVGIADGRFVTELIKNTRSVTCTVLVEPEEGAFLYACSRYDLSHLIKNENILIVTGTTDIKKKLETYINDRVSALIVRHMYTFMTPGYQAAYEDIRTYVAEQIVEIVLMVTTSINTELDHSRAMYKNRLSSLLYLPQSYTFGQLERQFSTKDIPVVLVGAGPSLQNNVDELRRLKGRAIIIGCTHAMETLKNHSVDVDMVAAIDMDAGSSFLKYDVEYKLLLSTECASDLQEKYCGNSIYFSFPKEFQGLETLQQELFEVPKGGSVITAVFNLFVSAGFKKFILVGEDLAYAEDGKTHSGSVQDGADVGDVFWTTGIDGSRIRSRHDWMIFREFFEKVIETDDSLQVIDATEGGALIKGTEIRTLKDVADECKETYPITEWLDALSKEKGITYQDTLEVYQNYEAGCREMQEYLSDAIVMNQRIRQSVKRRQMNDKGFNKMCVRYDELYKKITLSDEAEPLKQYCADVLYAYSEQAQFLEEQDDILAKLENEEKLFQGLKAAEYELREYLLELLGKMRDLVKGE